MFGSFRPSAAQVAAVLGAWRTLTPEKEMLGGTKEIVVPAPKTV
jgi:hypothetical protein